MSDFTIIDSTSYYRTLYPELMLSYNVNNDTTNVDSKSSAFKKKNISDMGRKKANRTLNGIIVYTVYTIMSIQVI